jgi:hypothetical protein
MDYSAENTLRPLRIKFDVYSDGDDHEFKSELVTLMIGSVQELHAAAESSINFSEADIFLKAAHKAKSTLVLLDDAEFVQAVEDFKKKLNVNEIAAMNGTMTRLTSICNSVVKSLEHEANQLK